LPFCSPLAISDLPWFGGDVKINEREFHMDA
jgi:hypothetical protein